MRVSKNIGDIERMLEKLRKDNRRTGKTPPWKIEARNGGYITNYLRTYRQEHREQLTRYMKDYRAAHPAETRAQWRADSARYRQKQKVKP